MPPPLQPLSKVHLVLVEILSEIFLLVVLSEAEDQKNLVLVCQWWYATVLSTPGMRSAVWIRDSTQKEHVQAAMQGRRLLHLSIDISTESIRTEFNTDDFHACLMAAAQEAS
jgi:hypothetical protein